MAVPVKIEWSVDERQFSIKLKGDFGVLSTPDGQLLELHAGEWGTLADVIRSHFRRPEHQKPCKPQRGKHGQPWLETDDQKLRGLFDSGTPVKAIAEEMDRSRGAIGARLAKLGLFPVRFPTRR